jgi:uncharacterized protein YbjT (DUF2867 family)
MRRVLVAGGYGLVGGWIARHLRNAGHNIDLVIGGRRPEAGAALARELGARVAQIDTEDAASSLARAGSFDLVISVLQDPNDNLLRAVLSAGAAHLGIVRKADNVGPTAITASLLALRPALVMGHWQAGVATFAAMATTQEFERVERIELAALFDYADPTGPMAANDSGAFFTKALVRHDRQWARIEPAENIRLVERGDLPAFSAQPMGVLDVPGLAAVTNATHVRFDLGTGDSAGTTAGGPASHEIYIDIWGRDRLGSLHGRRTVVSDPKGQAHLTAIGALIGAERVLGLDGRVPPGAGVVFPEAVVNPQRALARLRAFGVHITTEPSTPGQPAP